MGEESVGMSTHREERKPAVDDEPSRRPWFGAKRIGFGLRPLSWQGWLLTVVYVAAIVAAARLLVAHHRGAFYATLAAVTALYAAVAWAKRDQES